MLLIMSSNSFDLNEFYKKELKKLTKIVIDDLLIIITEQMNSTFMNNNTNTYSSTSS